MREAQHRRSDGGRFRAGETHHADAAAARGSGDGNDGVVEVHGEIIH